MKRIILFLVAITAGPVFAGPVKQADLPDIFKNEPPYIQNRICSELMAGMARMSANLYLVSGQPRLKEAAVLTGTRAMMFLGANASLTSEEEARAKRIAEQLERGVSVDHPAITPDRYCEERAQRWLKEGVVSQADAKASEKDVRAALEKALRSAKQH